MGTLRDLQFALQLKIEELRQRDTLIDELELELDTKDELIRRLQEELDRYRTTVSLSGPSASAAPSAQIEGMEGAKKHTVISEPFIPDPVTLARISHKSCDKSQQSRSLIQAALLKNDLLKNLDEGEMRAVTSCLYRFSINQSCSVIQEGSAGEQAFILEEGRLTVTKDGCTLLTAEPGEMIGELALLYNYISPFSVSAQSDSKLWVIDRKSFQTALMHCSLSRLSHSAELLGSLPLLQSLPEDVIMKISELVKETNYADGEYIIHQGAVEDNLYVISKGQVTLTEMKAGHEEHTVLSELSEEPWFGENAVWREDTWTVSAMAVGAVTCLVIDRETFKDITDGLLTDCHQEVQRSSEYKVETNEDPALLTSSTLSDFQIIRTLGVGEFGHLDLVQLKSNIKLNFAMRVLKRKLILNGGQREHFVRESRILMEAQCPFIVRVYKIFRDPEQLYILTEACLGGNLSSLVKEKGCLDDCTARFYTACVVEALIFLHHQGVVYRDIKPEHVVLDEHGYAKLSGSRCLKRLDGGKKTWTFCGTLGYMAPEIILSKGHGIRSDLWSLGVFVFELLSGRLPFDDPDQIKIITATVEGIDHVEFPKTICQDASDLIKKLCRSNPSERLGSQRNGVKDVQQHKWFEEFGWDGLCSRTLKPPVIPEVLYSCESITCALYNTDSVELCTNWEDF
ncbi:cGMP-dependent protein kinase 1 isoform X1 [Oryzias melastigma]|uniref:cGMP-dependent protein kinase n=2 Tax=Oryzias melastigma TaxID=30732 RepID=A0A3B3BQE1_ORYME|nr:cGMP-dependent protein kinase 1 isoform X1 [Oryzias melastigma]